MQPKYFWCKLDIKTYLSYGKLEQARRKAQVGVAREAQHTSRGEALVLGKNQYP